MGGAIAENGLKNFLRKFFKPFFRAWSPSGQSIILFFSFRKKIWRFFQKMPPAFFEKSPRFFPVSFLKNFDPFGVKIFQK